MAHVKTAEEAKGIPSRAVYKDPPKVKKPETWKMTVHQHKAERAGEHLDIRLGDPKTGITYNWATRKLPPPGKGTYAIPQPVHSMEYMDFKGKIPEGYGKGDVSIARKEPVEIREARPDMIRFNAYKGRVPEQYVIRKVPGDSKWVLHNATPSRSTKRWTKLVQHGKPKYKEKDLKSVSYDDDDEVMQAKIDGAHVQGVYEKGKPIRLFSHIKAKSTPTGLMEHTFKPVNLQSYRTPAKLHKSVIRGELYAVDRRGRALPSSQTGGLLNAGTWKSREQQLKRGVRLKLAPFDIERYKGRAVGREPYRRRYELLKKLVKSSPDDVELPPTAFNEPEKYKLLKAIMDKKLPQTEEGVVVWHRTRPEITKFKRKVDHDVYIRSIYPSTHEGWAGGFEYSYSPRGKIVGRVGSGLPRKLRVAMHRSPAKYHDRAAKVEAQSMLASGALRAPAFKGWHLEKGR
jgi:hypothetical protein